MAGELGSVPARWLASTMSRAVVAAGMLAAATCGHGARQQSVQPSSQAITIAPSRARQTAEDPRYRATLAAMRERLERARITSAFHMVIEPPFVVAGDEAPSMVEERAVIIVRWAVERLRAAYFIRDPDAVIEIWLFRDGDSYRRNARALFGAAPTTPYGYFDSIHRALVMDISTGGGTLVHEIVHPYVDANFPRCPAWFNEGLGSLYEQAGERDGAIIGLVNWRLPALQRALEAGTAPPLRQLLSADPGEFYGDASGLYYAAARYLLYYLQEQGLLRRYYAEFTASYERDPTGIDTLVAVTGRDLRRLETDWRRFVLRLRFYR
ncbi:MAG TPA: hypothetical protein VK698_03910 [Kofleriaceae bacterium]|nr:hypothetical protein [Kofleriaceae bacterium]